MAEARDPLPARPPWRELLAFPQPRHLHFPGDVFRGRVNTLAPGHAGGLEGTAPRARNPPGGRAGTGREAAGTSCSAHLSVRLASCYLSTEDEPYE